MQYIMFLCCANSGKFDCTPIGEWMRKHLRREESLHEGGREETLAHTLCGFNKQFRLCVLIYVVGSH